MADLRTAFTQTAASGGGLSGVRVAGLQLEKLRTVRRKRRAIEVYTHEAAGIHVVLRLKVQPHAVYYLYRGDGGWNVTANSRFATTFPNHNEAVWAFEEAWAGNFASTAPLWLQK